MRIAPGLAALVVLLLAPHGALAKQHYQRPGGHPPFSTAVRVGDITYLSGMIGVTPDGKVPATFEDQARQAMENVGLALRTANLSFGNVAKCTVMLTDMADYAAFNRIYTGYFAPDRLPARSAFAVTALAYGAHVEVECIAEARGAAREANPPPRVG